MDKVVASADEAVRDVPDGATVLAGGFGLCGNPENLIHALVRRGARDLTLVSNNCGAEGKGLGLLLEAGRIRRLVAGYVGENRTFQRLYLDGRIELELVPQGTLAERLRAAGAGLGGFYTPTGVGTPHAEGKETREIDGRTYVFERPLPGDFAIVKAWRGDRWGNLVYRKTARNFNPLCAMAGRVTIAEVEELVEPGGIDPDQVHTPGVFVQRVVEGERYEKPIQQRTVRPRA